MLHLSPELTWGSGGIALALLLFKATLILSVAWLLVRFCLRASAAIRHGIWAAALVLLVMLPLAGPWLPALPVDLHVGSLSAPAAPAPQRPSSPVAGEMDAVLWDFGEPPVTAPGGSRSVPEQASARGIRVHWSVALLVAWSFGVLLRLGWLGVQFARVRRLSGYARPEMDGRSVGLAEILARGAAIRRPVRVLESPLVSMPLTWGVLRPIVVLPEEAEQWPEERLRVVLLHELAHVRRWDYLTYLVAEIACLLYWPVPLVWLARRRVHLEQEQACDDLVLASGTGALEYAEHLLAVARAFYGNRWEMGAAVTMAREISLKDRIRSILDEHTNRRPLLSGSGVVTLLLLSGFALPVAAARPDSTATEPVSEPAGRPGEPFPAAAAPPVARQARWSDGSDLTLRHAYLWLEAEHARVRAPMQIREDLAASEAGYVVVPDGPGNDAPEGGPGEVELALNLPRSGDYLLWARVIGPHDNDDSFYVSVDGGEEIRFNVEDERGREVREWAWVALREAGGSGREPLRVRLEAGGHTLRVRNREDGTRLDRLLVTTDPDFVPSGRGAVLRDSRSVYRWMEAERAHLEGGMQTQVDEHASSGRSVSFEADGPDGTGAATFVFEVERAGRYLVWGRALAPGTGANSVYASLDHGAEVIWDVPEREPGSRAGWWTWSPMSARDHNGRTVDPLLFDLEPGRHVLRLRAREPGTRLDGILLTDDLAYVPRGIWPTSLPERPVRVWIEAESAHLAAPLLVGEDSAAVGGRFVRVERGSTRLDEPAAASAVLRFEVPQSGLYTLWGRTIAPSDREDSFWIRVNGGDWIRWNEIPRSQDWHWSAVHDTDRADELAQFQLRPGPNTLELARREGGAMIDRLLVTNDPLYEPGGTGAW